TLVPTDETGVRALFKHLKQGGFAAILPDHVPKESGGIYSPFFGQNALSSTLLSKLAAKTQCSVVGLSCLRREDLSGFEVHVQTLSAEINTKDLQLSVDTLNKEMERMINVAPEQYLWGYKRFRKVEGNQNPYKA
ncbi:lysophospholipid acyltransferase family protein, partial [Escherichia coli]